MSNTLAQLLLRERLVLSQRAVVEIAIWRLPAAAAAKGDHMHVEEVEIPYAFTDLQALQAELWRAVSRHRRGK